MPYAAISVSDTTRTRFAESWRWECSNELACDHGAMLGAESCWLRPSLSLDSLALLFAFNQVPWSIPREAASTGPVLFNCLDSICPDLLIANDTRLIGEAGSSQSRESTRKSVANHWCPVIRRLHTQFGSPAAEGNGGLVPLSQLDRRISLFHHCPSQSPPEVQGTRSRTVLALISCRFSGAGGWVLWLSKPKRATGFWSGVAASRAGAWFLALPAPDSPPRLPIRR